MSLNCNEINLILSELDLAGSFVQDIVQPGYDTIALYVYKEGAAKTVLICAKAPALYGIPKVQSSRRKDSFLRANGLGANHKI